MHRSGHLTLLFFLMAGMATIPARADVLVDDDSSEAQLMGFYAAALSFTPVGSQPGPRLEAGIEAAYLPSLSEEDRQTTFAGSKIENTNFTSVLGRVRARWRPARTWLLEAAAFPEAQVRGVTPDMYALSAASRVASWASGLDLWVRGHYLNADIEGPITCPEEAIEDPANSICFGGQVSSDHFRPEAYGLDVVLDGPRLLADSIAWYAAAGYRHETLRFETHFVNMFGRLDDQRLVARLDRGSILGGLTWTPTHGLRLTLEGSYAPDALVTARVGIGYGWGAP
jgi:hypothetical protein